MCASRSFFAKPSTIAEKPPRWPSTIDGISVDFSFVMILSFSFITATEPCSTRSLVFLMQPYNLVQK